MTCDTQKTWYPWNLQDVCESQKNPEIFNALSQWGLSQLFYEVCRIKAGSQRHDINQRDRYAPNGVNSAVPRMIPFHPASCLYLHSVNSHVLI